MQYFPNVEYSRRVLQGVVDSLTDGGALFVGDVRSLPLLEAFHTSVQMDQAPDDLPGAQLTTGLRDHLQACLPPYMAPSAFVFLASLPLTPNGKLDRKALPAPDIPVKSSDEYAPPRNPEEQQLCTIWQDVLGLNRVGVHDNFFHLGGHSLLAMQVISRVRGAFEVELPVSTLFTGPTVAQLAACLEQLTAVRGLTQSDVRDDIQYKKVTL